MSKLKLLTIAVIGLLVMNLCIVGFLFLGKPPLPPDGGSPFAKEAPRKKIIELLHFDNEQIKQYEELIQQHRESIRFLRDNIRETKSNLYHTLNEGNGSDKDSLINELGALQKKIEVVHYNHFMEIKKICKPDQLEYFNTLTGELADFFSPEREGRRPLEK
jgi:periplasmic protein CpxP/Spy